MARLPAGHGNVTMTLTDLRVIRITLRLSEQLSCECINDSHVVSVLSELRQLYERLNFLGPNWREDIGVRHGLQLLQSSLAHVIILYQFLQYLRGIMRQILHAIHPRDTFHGSVR